MNKIAFFDTTLRDGEQTAGVHFSHNQKVEIAKQLERLGVDCIEAGFPASSKDEANTVAAISRVITESTVCALARAVKEDIDSAYEAIKAAPMHRLHTFIATSDIHIQYKLKSTREEVLERVKNAVAYAKTLCDDVEFSAEDATRSDPDYLCLIFDAAIKAGATVINIPDTVGYSTPEEFKALIGYIESKVNTSSVTLSVHCHDDLGLAVSNNIAGFEAGARQFECTINGIGERAGNAALEELAMIFNTRKDLLGAEDNINTTEIVRTSRLIASLSGIMPSPNKSIVGANAFTHASGIHQHGMLCNRNTYEIMEPEMIGLVGSRIALGKLSGRHAFIEKLHELGYELDDETVNSAFDTFKEFANRKKEVTDDDIQAIVNEQLDFKQALYILDSFQIQSGNRMKSMAMITLKRASDGELLSEAALGDGPIDAAFNAIDRLLGATGKLQLENYNLKAVTEGTDALGEVMVKIRSELTAFIGRGVSSDIIKASIRAYLNASNKWLLSQNDTETGK